MSLLFRKPLVVTRYAGAWVKGRWENGTSTTFSIMASVQTSSDHDIMYLDIARRERKSYTLFSDERLNDLVASPGNPDRVTIDDEVFEVSRTAPWKNNVINHYKYVVTKMQAIEI